MDDEMLRSGPGAGGHRSPRRYTRAEVAAARRIGLAHGKEKHDRLGGPIFWAAGDYYPDQVRQGAADYALVLAAMEREWVTTNQTQTRSVPNPSDPVAVPEKMKGLVEAGEFMGCPIYTHPDAPGLTVIGKVKPDPEKVEVNRADLELILTDTDIYYPGYAEGTDEPSGLPERGAAAEDRLRAALAAFRATEEGK